MIARMGSQVYDAIADDYRESKWLLFRHFIERYTLTALLGDLQGRTVLDMACGEGVYARQFMRAGAAGVTGVDISPAMVELAEAQEREDPIGCRYVCADAGAFTPAAPFDVVTAIYLLNYARTAEQATRFCRACFHALRPGGLLVGFNDNVRNPPGPDDASLAKYGLQRTCARHPPQRGRRHPLPDHQPRRADVRVRQLLPAAGHLRNRHARRRIRGLPLGRRDARPGRAGRSLLGRLHDPGAAHRLLRDAAGKSLASTREDPCDGRRRSCASLHPARPLLPRTGASVTRLPGHHAGWR